MKGEISFTKGAMYRRIDDPVTVHPRFSEKSYAIYKGDLILVLEVSRTAEEKEYVSPAYDILVLHYGSSTGLGTITGTLLEFWERIC